MKIKAINILIIAAFFCSLCCRKIDAVISDPVPPVLPPISGSTNPVIASIQGNIVDENELPVQFVSITIGNKSTVTDSLGFFRIDNASLDKMASLLTGQKAGYLKIVRSFAATSGTNYQKIKLIKKKLVANISSTIGGTVNMPDGSKIVLPANGVKKKSDNSSYTGNINVYAASLDPTSPDISETLPGLTANDSTGKKISLFSYGMLAIELESTLAEPLQMIESKTASLSFNIPSSRLNTAPSSVPLWYLDDSTGIWKQEGSAQRSGNLYIGQVKHFTFWNCDEEIPSVLLTILVKDISNLPVPYTLVELQSDDYGTRYGFTDSLGQVSGLVASKEFFQCSIGTGYKCIDRTATQKIGPFTSASLYSFIMDTSHVIKITGNFLNCNRESIITQALVYRNDIKYIIPVNASGDFTFNLARCGSSDSINITGINAMGVITGPTYFSALTSAFVNTGSLSPCQIEAPQFITYTMDSLLFQMTDSNQDVFKTYVDTSYLLNSTLFLRLYFQRRVVNPMDSVNYNFVMFTFRDTKTIGTEFINVLEEFNFYSVPKDPDIDLTDSTNSSVTLTKYAARAGDFFEGSFKSKGTFDDLKFHQLGGNFRIRRTY